MKRDEVLRRSVDAAVRDVGTARVEFDDAAGWLAAAGERLADPLAVEVWVFDADLAQVLLVRHRWRGWVPPGGKVEPGETPREAASRELFEETGLRAELLAAPAAASVRSYHPDWPATLGLSYTAIVDLAAPLAAEAGQPAAWTDLDHDWHGYFPDDPSRIRQHAWLAGPADLDDALRTRATDKDRHNRPLRSVIRCPPIRLPTVHLPGAACPPSRNLS